MNTVCFRVSRIREEIGRLAIEAYKAQKLFERTERHCQGYAYQTHPKCGINATNAVVALEHASRKLEQAIIKAIGKPLKLQ